MEPFIPALLAWVGVLTVLGYKIVVNLDDRLKAIEAREKESPENTVAAMERLRGEAPK